MANFNVTSFDALVTGVMAGSESFVAKLKNASSVCTNSANLYRSEDSNLANTYNTVADSIALASNRFSEIINQLVELLMKYRASTLENETNTASQVSSINEALTAAIGAIGNLK